MIVRDFINSSMLEQKCLNHEAAWHQREEELLRSEGLSGTKSYEITGCYACDGYNKECPYYLILEGKKE